VAACARSREAAANPQAYCFGAPDGPLNVWSCRLLDMPWAENAEWFSLGTFRDSDTFVFDRKAIRERLAAGLERVRECPYLRPDVCKAAVDELPSRASVWGRWRRRIVKADSPRATPLAAREYRHGCDVSSSVICDGMAPLGDDEAVRTILAVSKRCALGRVTRKALAGGREV